VLVIAAAARVTIEQTTADIGVKGLASRFVFLELIEATAAAAIAEAFPFQIGHFAQ
jgi:hypothetical protein